MPIIQLNSKREKVLNDFAKEYKERTLAFLSKYFSLCKEDCEDIFQDASISLYLSAIEGKLDNLTASLYTYFIGICRNKAHERIRANQKRPTISLDDDLENGKNTDSIISKADKILCLIDEDEKLRSERQQLVQSIVKQLPSPCNELLWAFYRDALSMIAIAKMFGYASENTAKVTKHRCMEKFSKQYNSSTSSSLILNVL